MRSKKIIFLCFLTLSIAVLPLLCLSTSTQQCINYNCRTIIVPLYLKVLNFLDRHCNYIRLTNEIIGRESLPQQKVLALLSWTYRNIHKLPDGAEVVDDHVWNIIIRRFGTNDQSADVFSTLCNYAGLSSFYQLISAIDDREKIPLSFVKIDKEWHVFDTYHGVYFLNSKNGLASIHDIKKGDCKIAVFVDEGISLFDYRHYFPNLPDIPVVGLHRANIQSPIRRLKFALEKFAR
ncbi:MAG: hypothetical protein A2Y00_03170 [Omnitrophica WOR_2 bacterium GWF2_43_52]|nr:MAG: hypothetical protein A2Y00_03170 [Omnitrophica WOR_2 bacterium GWF2_43_52]OGX57642.1 MAG: hypothetical protein A2460_02680 [Omnitrophica WOR_2 bacterium RIFOXYC2_FULL_43_9]HAH20854.1 hypothetical protein [Candidatus Omnitrophota bacterium]HBG64522.1 hypothetical protein [Candidatus Omnitrophota bacterium]